MFTTIAAMVTALAMGVLKEQPRVKANAVNLGPPVDRPLWISQPLGRSENVYRTKVVSEPWPTDADCLASLEGILANTTTDYLKNLLGKRAYKEFQIDLQDRSRGQELLARLDLDIAYIHEHICAERFSEPHVSARAGLMRRLHLLLEFDEKIQSQLKRRWEEALVRGRVLLTVSVALLVLALLATFLGYVNLDRVTGRIYTRRLQVIAGTIILALSSMGLILLTK